MDDLNEVDKFKEVFKSCPLTSTLAIVQGLVMVNPNEECIGHKYTPLVRAGFSFHELTVVMRSKIIDFEDEYGEINLTKQEKESLCKIIYQFNMIKSNSKNYTDKKFEIHLSDTAEVLYYLLQPGIKLNNIKNGWCSLTFTHPIKIRKEYCAILIEEQIELLEKVNSTVAENSK